jgi:hypothetical protein
VDIDHREPEKCIDCGQDAYIRLAGTGTEDYVCAHCFADRGRNVRTAKDPARASQSPPTRSAEGAAR